jgi:tetratricopeptide (TPR) repeat protein
LSSPCDGLFAFVDGELEGGEAAAFQAHLARCRDCSRGLQETLILDDLVARSAASPARRSQRWPLRLAAGGAMALAAGLLLLLIVGGGAKPEALVTELAAASARTTETRLSYAPADGYRRYAPMRGEGGAVKAPIHLLGRIEASGDRRATAAAYFLLGMQSQAGVQLADLGDSAGVLNDRAATLLELGRSDEALPLLERALRLQPDHRQALWNRGLALRRLGRPAEASRDFAAVARLEQGPWADEARRRSEALLR